MADSLTKLFAEAGAIGPAGDNVVFTYVVIVSVETANDQRVLCMGGKLLYIASTAGAPASFATARSRPGRQLSSTKFAIAAEPPTSGTVHAQPFADEYAIPLVISVQNETPQLKIRPLLGLLNETRNVTLSADPTTGTLTGVDQGLFYCVTFSQLMSDQ